MGHCAKIKLFWMCFCVNTCVFQPPQSFAELLADGGSTVWPLWELIKWIFGKSDHTLPSIGNTPN